MVTIPTIDQISGTTVMNKMRSLIHAFINFATEIDADLTVISTQASNAYDLATDTAGQFADLQALVQNNYYTKSETDTLLGRRAYQFNVTAPLYKIQYSAYEDSVGIHFDGETVINGNSGLAVNIDDDTLYYDSVSGKVKALTYSAGVGTSMNLAREINVNVSDGLYVNTNNAIMSKIDGDTIKFDSNGVMHVSIDNDTIKFDATNGVIYSSGSYTAGDGVTINNGVISLNTDSLFSYVNGALTIPNTWISGSSADTNVVNKYSITQTSYGNNGNYFILGTPINAKSIKTGGIELRTNSGGTPYLVGVDWTLFDSDLMPGGSYLYLYDLDGTLIDSTTIANYINSSGVCIKPFVLRFNATYNAYYMGSAIATIGDKKVILTTIKLTTPAYSNNLLADYVVAIVEIGRYGTYSSNGVGYDYSHGVQRILQGKVKKLDTFSSGDYNISNRKFL